MYNILPTALESPGSLTLNWINFKHKCPKLNESLWGTPVTDATGGIGVSYCSGYALHVVAYVLPMPYIQLQFCYLLPTVLTGWTLYRLMWSLQHYVRKYISGHHNHTNMIESWWDCRRSQPGIMGMSMVMLTVFFPSESWSCGHPIIVKNHVI